MILTKRKLFRKCMIFLGSCFLKLFIIIHILHFIYMKTKCILYNLTMEMYLLFEHNSLMLKYHWDFGKQNFDISGLKDESYEYYNKYARTVGAKYANTFISYVENSRYYIARFAYDNKFWTLIYDKQSKNIWSLIHL